MEVMIPVHTTDFEFSSAMSTPFSSPPSTPKRFGEQHYYSAPTSPAHLSHFYQDFDHISGDGNFKLGPNSSSGIQFEEEDDDFAFDFSEVSERNSLSADELFAGGKIRPLEPAQARTSSEIKLPLISSPSKRKKGSDRSGVKIGETQREKNEGRGRDRVSRLSSSSNSSRRGARSVSPLRVSAYPWEEEEQEQSTKQASSTPEPSLSASFSKRLGFRKWKLSDLFLFRSASEGRATERDPLKKYTALFRKNDEKQNTSLGSSENSSSRRRGKVSAHELHYTANRAIAEDLRKKTYLPYKQGILGRLAFSPPVSVHSFANGFGMSRR